eukprot:2662755-Amphidinium_carterae.1
MNPSFNTLCQSIRSIIRSLSILGLRPPKLSERVVSWERACAMNGASFRSNTRMPFGSRGA